MSDFDPRELRNAFGTFMTGVTVVTAVDPDGNPLGFTANSFTSVSLDPPIVLVCLANSSSNYDVFANASGFAVNILAETQIDISNTFARPVEDRFSQVDWEIGPAGSPILKDVSAWFDCVTFKNTEAGDHLVLMGEVKAFDHNITPGLGYARGAYVTPSAEMDALNSKGKLTVSALIELNGKVLLTKNKQGHYTLPYMEKAEENICAAIKQIIETSGVTTEPGFIYSVYDDTSSKGQHISFLCRAEDWNASQGEFLPLTTEVLANIENTATRKMLERFAAESQLGNFGVYYGNEDSGTVKSLLNGER